MTQKFAFVIPRWFPDMAGGAETLCFEIAKKLSSKGYQIDILTTCAKDNRSWNNEFPPGELFHNDIRIIRYKVNNRNLDKWVPLQISITQGFDISLEEELTWMEESANSSDLYTYIQNKGTQYDALFFAPCLFGITFFGSLIYPERSILIPCLHDESSAYLKCMQYMFSKIKGCIFNSYPEKELAELIYGNLSGDEVGMGFDYFDLDEIDQYKNSEAPSYAPYCVYIGRKETGKNVHLLIDNFIAFKDKYNIELNLVIAGGGSFSDLFRESSLLRTDVFDIGHLDEISKRKLIKNSLFLVQPSVNESFSIVLMEAWRLQVPVLVNAFCPVTKYHVTASGGGLYFSDEEDFNLVVETLVKDSQFRKQLGNAGKLYVESRFNWDEVINRFESAVNKIIRN